MNLSYFWACKNKPIIYTFKTGLLQKKSNKLEEKKNKEVKDNQLLGMCHREISRFFDEQEVEARAIKRPEIISISRAW